MEQSQIGQSLIEGCSGPHEGRAVWGCVKEEIGKDVITIKSVRKEDVEI